MKIPNRQFVAIDEQGNASDEHGELITPQPEPEPDAIDEALAILRGEVTV